MISKILIRAPKTLKEKLKVVSQKMGISVNALILQILWDYFEEKEKEKV